MICQNCHSNVDDDLIFCTSCGVRLIQPANTSQNRTAQPTVVLSNQTEQQTVVSPKQVQKKSSFKWILLIVGLIIVPIVLGFAVFAYLSLNSTKTISKKSTPKPTPTAKRKNKPVENPIDNSNSEVEPIPGSEENSNTDLPNEIEETEKSEKIILDETVSVDKDAYIVFPFKVKDDSVEIDGKVEILDGEQYDGYVFIQEVYDEYHVNPTFKMFSFGSGEGKISNVRQYLIKGDYVLVFVNTDGKGVQVKADFTQTPQ